MPWNHLRICAALLAVGLAWSCSSGGNDYGMGGNGGTTRIFASGNLAGNGAAYSHTFTAAGSVPYYCRYHGGPGGAGMSGVITVTDPPRATPVDTTYSIVGNTLPSWSIKTGDKVTWINNSGTTHTVESDN